jgi:transcriptional regulator with XRE-family HTH domain
MRICQYTRIEIMEKDIILKLGYKIRYERDKRGISQEELAELAQVSIKTIGKLERGICNITIKNLYNIAKVLDLDLGILTNFKF